MKKFSIIFLTLTLAFSAIAQVKVTPAKSRSLKRLIPVNVNISTDSNSVLAPEDISMYIGQLLEELNDKLEIKLFPVEENNDPEVVLNLEITDFNSGVNAEIVVNNTLSTTSKDIEIAPRCHDL